MVQKGNKILLHSCCAICSGYPILLLKEMGYNPIVYFYNPNIDTQEEYTRRLEAQKTLCSHLGVKLIVEKYIPEEYLNYVVGFENEPEKGLRCEKCIELRLKQAAKKADELNIEKITTSLVISPHKNYEKITELGETISKKYLAIPFRKNDGFLKTNKLSKELNLYRQNYCGCKFAKKI
jgi:predicted adenine nucleotide alpha hydrolase (AANH) superfamily ATPase